MPSAEPPVSTPTTLMGQLGEFLAGEIGGKHNTILNLLYAGPGENDGELGIYTMDHPYPYTVLSRLKDADTCGQDLSDLYVNYCSGVDGNGTFQSPAPGSLLDRVSALESAGSGSGSGGDTTGTFDQMLAAFNGTLTDGQNSFWYDDGSAYVDQNSGGSSQSA